MLKYLKLVVFPAFANGIVANGIFAGRADIRIGGFTASWLGQKLSDVKVRIL
jgi:hypothetical protein